LLKSDLKFDIDNFSKIVTRSEADVVGKMVWFIENCDTIGLNHDAIVHADNDNIVYFLEIVV